MPHSQTGNLSAQFNQLLEDYSQIESPEAAELLSQIVQRYPWFSLAHYALLRADRQREQWQYTLTRLPYKPYPTILTDHTLNIEYHPLTPSHNQETEERNKVVDSAIEYFSSLPSPQELETRSGQKQPKEHTEIQIEHTEITTELTPSEKNLLNAERLKLTDKSTPPTLLPKTDLENVASQELVTETLAQIYLSQGHKQRAIEIYLKLSLKYPEKSSYFADLINHITSQ